MIISFSHAHTHTKQHTDTHAPHAHAHTHNTQTRHTPPAPHIQAANTTHTTVEILPTEVWTEVISFTRPFYMGSYSFTQISN